MVKLANLTDLRGMYWRKRGDYWERMTDWEELSNMGLPKWSAMKWPPWTTAIALMGTTVWWCVAWPELEPAVGKPRLTEAPPAGAQKSLT